MTTQRTICILGGSGFVGTHLASRLVDREYSLRIPTRSYQRARHLLVLPTVKLVEADVHDEKQLRQLVEGCDVVINLIGILNEKGHSGKGFRHAHVDLARKLVRACQHAGVPRLMQMSSLNADPGGPSHYLRTRGEAENIIRLESGSRLRTTIFQPSTIFGPQDTFINRFAKLLRIMPVFPLACPDARFAPVYVGDVAEAFIRAMDDPHTDGKRYQLCGPDTLTLREILQATCRTMGIRRWIIPLPDFLSRWQANMLEFFPGKPFSRDNYNSMKKDSVCTQDGLKALGIKPTGMDAVVPQYLANRTAKSRYYEYRKIAGRL